MTSTITVVAGVTASGKSQLCNALTEQYNNIVVINCDSKQVYEEIPIITAQPLSKKEESHRLYGYVSVKENYSVGLWLQDLKKEVSSALQNSQIPIITGGSGLYISSLVKGLSSIPQISQEVRKNVNELSRNLDRKEFYRLAISKDPHILGKIHINDSHRVSRALEVVIESGKSMFTLHDKSPALPYNFKIYTILPDREYVYNMINFRFLEMVEHGVVDEVKALLAMNLDPSLPAMKAHGVPEIIRYLNSELTFEEAINIAQTSTRHYAKRQYTWFRHQFPHAEVINRIGEFLKAFSL